MTKYLLLAALALGCGTGLDCDCRAAVEAARARECTRWVGIKGPRDEHATLFDARGAHSLVFELDSEYPVGYRLRRDGESE